jgi:alpha-beta hydrolase superfamily lysophospholipase
MASDTQSGFRPARLVSTTDGLEIGVLSLAPDSLKPKGIVQLVHGMCEHKERYMPFMEYLAANGYACVIHDHRGHGESVKSSEDLGYFYEGGARAMVYDIKMVTSWAKETFPGLPLILFGHSMGSMAVRSYVKRFDTELSGLVVCGSPSYNPGLVFGKFLASLNSKVFGKRHRPKLIQNMAFGAFNHNFRHEPSHNSWICSDPEIVKSYDNDPLCTFQFTSDGFLNLFRLMQDAYSLKGWKCTSPDLPVLFISGDKDPCMADLDRFDDAVGKMRKAGYRHVSSILYPGMRHEILNETGKERVWADVLEFCDRSVK